MLYHPHVHFLVTAGGLAPDGQSWLEPRNPRFLVSGKALGLIFRAKVRDALVAAGFIKLVPAAVWKKAWVVHVQHAGSGDKVLGYLARYVFRIALTNKRRVVGIVTSESQVDAWGGWCRALEGSTWRL